MKGVLRTEALRLMKAAAAKLLDLMLASKTESWRLSRLHGYNRDCPAGERGIQAGMALDDVATAYASHLSDDSLFIGRLEMRPYMTDAAVRAIVEKLNTGLEALEFKDYPGGARGAKKDAIRARATALHLQGAKASTNKIAAVLDESHAFVGEWDSPTRKLLDDLATRIESKTGAS